MKKQDEFTRTWILQNALEEIFDQDLHDQLMDQEAEEREIFKANLKEFVKSL